MKSGTKVEKHNRFYLPRLAVFRSIGSSRLRRVDKEAADPARIISSVNISTCKRRFSGEKQGVKLKTENKKTYSPSVHA